MKRWASHFISYVCVLVIAGLLCPMVQAQVGVGSISGTVVDPTGAVIPGAQVTLLSESTGATRETTSSSGGDFVFPALPPGKYTVTVKTQGFAIYSRKGVTVAISQRTALGSLKLVVGKTTQAVTVTMQGIRVNTESADVAPNLTPTQLSNIPVAGRDVMQLLRVLPGVGSVPMVPWGEISQNDPAGPASNGGQFGSFTPNADGARLFWNTVTVDGQVGSNPDFPGLFMSAISMDAVSEAKVVSNNYTADYGRNPGPTISLLSKSGTKDFHGFVYFYKRHEKLNANDFFNNAEGLPKPVYRFTTLGFDIGGPVYIPRLFNVEKKKLFFFFSEEDWQTSLPQGVQKLTVPTLAERNGDFSQTFDQSGNLRVITNPVTHQPFAGNVIPASEINTNGQLLLNLMPLPNVNNPLGDYNFEWQDVCDIPKRLQTLKLDYNPTSKDTISILPRRWWSDTRAYTCRTLGYGGNLPIYKHHYHYSTDSIVINWTHMISGSLVNMAGSGFTGEKEQGPAANLFGRTAANYFDPVRRANTGFTLGQLFPAANTFDILPQALFNFVPSLSGAPSITADARFPDSQGYERFHFLDNLNWIRGAHTFEFGVYFERNWATDGPHADCFDGCFDFTHNPNNPLDSGWDFSNALLGVFNAYSESNLRQRYQARANDLEWFAQDTWKATKKLTFNYGIRFAYFNPWHVGNGGTLGIGAEFVPGRYDASAVPPLWTPTQDPNGPPGTAIALNPLTGALGPAVNIGAFAGPFNYTGMVLSTDATYPQGFREQHGVQVAPRFGFAFDPFGNGKTAIRGGFGIFKEDLPTYNTYVWTMVSNPPVQIEPTIFYGTMDTLLQRAGLVFPSGASSIQLRDKVPSVYKWSLGVERDLGLNTIADVSYVGNVGHHLIQSVNVNEVPYGARFQPQNIDPVTGTPLADTFFSPYPGYGSISTLMNAGWSNYNSLQVAVNHRMSRNLSFGISYTWSRSMGTGANDGDSMSTYQPWRTWMYGPTLFDQRQVFVANYVWDLPRASSLVPNGIVKAMFDNWEVSGVTTFATGTPQPINLSTTTGEDITGGGDGARALVIAPVELSPGQRGLNQWFNPNAFALPQIGDAGNASVFPFYGPGQNNWDITVEKKIPLWSESRSLQFRTEMYNAFNHTQFDAVDNNAIFDPATGKQVNGDFGHIVATRFPRVIQLSLRLEF